MTLKIAEWNANGLCRHAQQIQTFIQNLDLDMLLILETNFTDRSYIKIPKYHVYNTNYPDGTAHGSSAIIIKQSNITNGLNIALTIYKLPVSP
jgi:exonuclease III